MNDDAISRMIREKRGLPENWRIYKYEAQNGKVKLTGSLARPSTEYESGHPDRICWIYPETGKATATITLEAYRDLVQKP